MLSREDFIERATAVSEAYNRFEELRENAEKVFGEGCFEKFYDTGIITEMVNSLAATINDEFNWVYWIIVERRNEFPFIGTVWFNKEKVDLEDWGDVYDAVQREREYVERTEGKR